MNINISAHHTELTPALEEAVNEKFSRFQEHVEKEVHAKVILRVDSGQHVVEATVTGLGTAPISATTTQKDMYAAINEASHLIDRQWRKVKTAQLAQRRRGSIKKMNT